MIKFTKSREMPRHFYLFLLQGHDRDEELVPVSVVSGDRGVRATAVLHHLPGRRGRPGAGAAWVRVPRRHRAGPHVYVYILVFIL